MGLTSKTFILEVFILHQIYQEGHPIDFTLAELILGVMDRYRLTWDDNFQISADIMLAPALHGGCGLQHIKGPNYRWVTTEDHICTNGFDVFKIQFHYDLGEEQEEENNPAILGRQEKTGYRLVVSDAKEIFEIVRGISYEEAEALYIKECERESSSTGLPEEDIPF